MKIFITGLFILISNQVMAFGGCPMVVKENATAEKLIQFLKPYEGRHQLGSCQVEIQVCAISEESNDPQSVLVADMLVVDKSGYERYIPFYFPHTKDSRVFQEQVFDKNSAQYRFRDLNPDEATGKNERWRAEIVLKKNLSQLDYIEVGYTSHLERKQGISHRWIVCGDHRESEYENNGFLKSYKSFRNWILLWGEPNEQDKYPIN